MKTKRITIYDIKRLTEPTSPYFFTHKTLKCFGQTMKSFSVCRQADGKYYVSAPMYDRFTGRQVGMTKRIFNPITNELEHVTN